MRNLDIPFEIKSAAKDGSVGKFQGFASVFGNVDLGGDVVERGAFTKTLSEGGKEVPMLWQHHDEEPIGLIRMEEQEKGLYVFGEVDLDIPQGQRAYSGLTKKYIKGLSIGYRALKDAMLANGVRQLLEVKVFEVSVVTFPMNPLAGVTTLKRHAEDAEVREGLMQTNALLRNLTNDVAIRNLVAAQTGRLKEALRELRRG